MSESEKQEWQRDSGYWQEMASAERFRADRLEFALQDLRAENRWLIHRIGELSQSKAA